MLTTTPADLRKICPAELPQLLALYRYLHPDDPQLPLTPDLEALWQQITGNPHLFYFESDKAAFGFIEKFVKSENADAPKPNTIRFLDENHLNDINEMMKINNA